LELKNLIIRPYRPEDQQEVIDLWFECDLVIPDNNPERDIARKLKVNPEWFLVGVLDGKVVATCMAGYEGHRGWINYLAVSPSYQRRGIAARVMEVAEANLRKTGCVKINLQIRASNTEVIEFYKSIGYSIDDIMNMGKRLGHDPPYVRKSDIPPESQGS
jgi:ribosomal protein S18 acetylase RimI-like enzyme